MFVSVGSTLEADALLGERLSPALPELCAELCAEVSTLRTVPEDEELDTSHVTPLSLTSSISTPDTIVVPSVLVRDANDKAVSFHERATSKDVIDELNRMIRKGEGEGEEPAPLAPGQQPSSQAEAATRGPSTVSSSMDSAAFCCPTGWVHVERDIDFTDPKVSSSVSPPVV